MEKQELKKLKVGDRITFKSVTRWGNKKETRKVNGFWFDGRPTVRFGGWGNFVVNWNEIKNIVKG